MVTVTRFLLFTTTLLSPASAYRRHGKPTTQGIKWLEPERSVLVRLETPDLPLWNPQTRVGEDVPTALILNFTFTRDNRVLLLNDQPILPIKNGNVPPSLSAPQTLSGFEQRTPDFYDLSWFELDYYRGVPLSEDPNSRYNIWSPTLNIDILGAGIEGYNTLLQNDTQRYVRVAVDEIPPYQKYPYEKTISKRRYKIKDVTLEDRFPYQQFAAPDALKECRIWSWLCDDIPDFPYYHYVYRQSFDEYGKIGSLRHELHQRWGTLCERLGMWRVVLLLVVVGNMVLTPVFYGVYKCLRRLRSLHTRREVRYELLTAEETEDLLREYNQDREDEFTMDRLMTGLFTRDRPTVRTEVANDALKGKPLPPLPTESTESSSRGS
ncbi:uncharacterized protein PAC_13961 [Phialocephala subalpina]|uniref:Uncharacterized protein n=1 Tax=Phialocephala subalpina TaxID=576137 RepID=A0A1L7XGB7_9HELO|nr:uncharacterized protein PAC_13961 [Phialocephala subalpina]